MAKKKKFNYDFLPKDMSLEEYFLGPDPKKSKTLTAAKKAIKEHKDKYPKLKFECSCKSCWSGRVRGR